jgi:hypothetical protein
LNDEEKVKIEVLAADGQSPTRIAKLVKRSPHTVQKHLEQPGVAEKVQDEKAVLAEKYRAQARRILDSINDKDIEKASLQQKSISSGVLLDKSLLLAGDVPPIRVEILLAAVSEIRAQRERDDPAARTRNQQLPAETA